MDPLVARLACACVEGHAQRRYDQLAAFLEGQLEREVRVSYAEGMPEGQGLRPRDRQGECCRARRPTGWTSGPFDRDAHRQEGLTTLEGLFVVRGEDPARSIADLREQRLVLGPADQDEKHSAAVGAGGLWIFPGRNRETSPACNAAALAVVEEEADATVISDYAMPLLTGCGTLEKGELRIVGGTDPVPFIGVFATQHFPPTADAKLPRPSRRWRGGPPCLPPWSPGTASLPCRRWPTRQPGPTGAARAARARSTTCRPGSPRASGFCGPGP